MSLIEGRPPRSFRLYALIWLWRFFFPILFILTLPTNLLRLIRRGGYRHKFWERLGCFDPATKARLRAGAPWTWLHAVSVGEMLMALRLAEAWKKQNPSLHLVISVTTTTGFAQAKDKLQPWIELIYHPIDLAPVVSRTLKLLRPVCIVFVEAAIWPDLLVQAKRLGTTCAIVNARMSPRSQRRYRKFGWLSRPLFRLLDLVAIQDEAHREIWEYLGVPNKCIIHTGSIKFDIAPPPTDEVEQRRTFLKTCDIPLSGPILLGGSTWPGEERALAETLLVVRKTYPKATLVLVPRHVERTAAIFSELVKLGLQVALRTGPANIDHPDVLIVNTTGELRYWYPLAHVIFVGKSLFEKGGQNPVEPALTGRPLIAGPHMENFSEIVSELESVGLLKRIPDKSELTSAILSAISSPTPSRIDLSFLQSHRGATLRTVEALMRQKTDCTP